MTTTQTLKRAAGVVGALGATTGLALVPSAQAAPTAYATGWQCISPFISSYASAAAPDGFLDSLDIAVARTGNALTATKDQALYLDGATLSLEFKNPDPLKLLWERTGGVSTSYTGVPGWANDSSGTPQWLASGDAQPGSKTISLRIKADDGLSYWSYTVGSGSAAVINYAPTPVSATALTGLSNIPLPTAHPDAPTLTSSTSLGHGYLSNRNNNNFPITSYVTIEGTNTVEKYQTVRVDGYWTVNVQDPTPGSATYAAGYSNADETVSAPRRTFTLPSSKWTPTGDGPVEFRIAPPGNSAPVEIESKGYDRDGYNRPVKVRPFGSVFVRADTKAYASSNDCVNGTIAVKDSSISTGSNAGFIGNASPSGDAELGDVEYPGFLLSNNFFTSGTKTAVKGVAGRYETTQAVQPSFATAALATTTTTTTSSPAPAVALSASVLGVSNKKTSINVSNNTSTDTKYTVSVVTKSKYKSGSSKKKLTVTPTTTTTVKAGETAAVSLSVKKAVRSLLAKRNVIVHVTVTPQGGTAKTYSVTLTQL
ncbi:MAG: hypothetical protein QM679_10215 [Patulibacter sp.]